MALHCVDAVLRPASFAEAWKEKKERGEAARFLGGGVDLAVFTPPSVTTLIDLKRLGLSEIRPDGEGIIIGATATMTEVAESRGIAEYADGFLVEVLRHVASPLQRNLATFGGTIARAHPWSDVIPALLVLDAQVSIYDGEERILPLSAFYERRAGGSKPLILSIRLPKQPESGRGAFVKYGRTGFDVGVLNCACFAAGSSGMWSEVRVAIGGTPALARRVSAVERALGRQRVDSSSIEAAAAIAAKEVAVRDDRRASAGYRRTLIEVAVRRCLERIVEGWERGTA